MGCSIRDKAGCEFFFCSNQLLGQEGHVLIKILTSENEEPQKWSGAPPARTLPHILTVFVLVLEGVCAIFYKNSRPEISGSVLCACVTVSRFVQSISEGQIETFVVPGQLELLTAPESMPHRSWTSQIYIYIWQIARLQSILSTAQHSTAQLSNTRGPHYQTVGENPRLLT